MYVERPLTVRRRDLRPHDRHRHRTGPVFVGIRSSKPAHRRVVPTSVATHLNEDRLRGLPPNEVVERPPSKPRRGSASWTARRSMLTPHMEASNAASTSA